MIPCYLGLGSNLRSPTRQVRQTMAMLRSLPRTTLRKKSRCFVSTPCGPRSQPRYCNAVVLIHTTLPPRTLLRHCQAIERRKGRVRKKHWGSRTIDIDLLLYGQRVIKTHELNIPHPGLLLRDFVIVPLLSLSPTLRIPNEQSLPRSLGALTTHYLIKSSCR